MYLCICLLVYINTYTRKVITEYIYILYIYIYNIYNTYYLYKSSKYYTMLQKDKRLIRTFKKYRKSIKDVIVFIRNPATKDL